MALIQKGYPSFHDYIDFINYCFGMNGASHAFDKLLPKLYADGKTTSDDTYFALEGDRIVGTVLAYPLTFTVGNTTLQARGIGSVATHPRHRGEGFMKAMMKEALDAMARDGIDFSVLGGRRRRYYHFGFEKCDGMLYYALTPKTVSYLAPDTEGYTIQPITKEDTALLDELHTHMHRRPYYTHRPREALYDILVSWYATPYAYFKGDRLVGWAIHYGSKRQLSEFEYLDEAAVPAMLALSVRTLGDLSVAVPAYEEKKGALIDPFAETVTDVSNECFLVFNFKNTLSALLNLKAAHCPLCDGSLTVAIHGYAKTETLAITVHHNTVSVEDTDRTPEITLSLTEAELFFFRNHAPGRERINPQAASWLPLPLFIHECDNV
ncbi:MAG: GNAT family N-acetyltransferase [Clostridia bacterium]|nr:GNAT family N-acetyltransferase [Clostridia bacterium]